jgi:hypothetical protein
VICASAGAVPPITVHAMANTNAAALTMHFIEVILVSVG